VGLPEVKYITQMEYLSAERAASQKYEYYNGEVFAMSGASLKHNVIFRNTYIKLGLKLQGKSCQPFGSDLRIHIPKNTLYTYPDITIICGEPETTDDTTDTISNPTVIIEILSKSKRDYDKGSKFTLYRDIPTLKDYILIDSESVRVEKYSRNVDNSWLLNEYKTEKDSLLIESIQESLSLSDIYFEVMESV
jgi:Uma2 family endonuclease